ncbi:Hypothetical protein FKW44_005526, partial [Caligus rogercresseyi]
KGLYRRSLHHCRQRTLGTLVFRWGNSGHNHGQYDSQSYVRRRSYTLYVRF